MDLDIKIILGLGAIVVAFFNYLPYLIGVMRHRIYPHAFSWIIFTIITATISIAQFSAGAGSGAWATGATSLTTFLIACWSLKNGGYRVTKVDQVSILGALLAIPAWIITANPFAAVIILTTVETLGFLPTYRKAWHQPHDESIFAFTLTILKYCLALGAMQSYTLTTILFPAALIVLSAVLICEVTIRRRVLCK